jgi:AcrR family transcriptional regulator
MAATAPIATLKRTQSERTAQSDSLMLDAAIRLIVERGTANTHLKDVGESAGYSRGLASYRYGNKAGLFIEIIHTVGDEWLRELGRAVRDKDGLPAILGATDAHYRFVLEAADRIRAFYILWFDSTGPDQALKSVIANVHDRRQRDVEAWIAAGIAAGNVRSDVNVRSVAEQFCASIIGIVYQWLAVPESPDRIHDLHEGLKQQMIGALAVPNSDVQRDPE